MLTVVILGILAFYLGWFDISTRTDSVHDKVNVELTLDKAKVKQDTADAAAKARELGEKTQQEVKEVGRKIGDLADREKEKTSWKLDRSSIELEKGGRADVSITRSGDLSSRQFGLYASAGSNLVVSGGTCKAGEAVCSITVEAPEGASDGSIQVVGDGKTETLNVTVKP